LAREASLGRTVEGDELEEKIRCSCHGGGERAALTTERNPLCPGARMQGREKTRSDARRALETPESKAQGGEEHGRKVAKKEGGKERREED